MKKPSPIALKRAAEIVALLASGNRSLTQLLAVAYERGIEDAAQAIMGKINDR